MNESSSDKQHFRDLHPKAAIHRRGEYEFMVLDEDNGLIFDQWGDLVNSWYYGPDDIVMPDDEQLAATIQEILDDL